MTSPSPLPIPPRNDTPLDVGTNDYSISCIFGMLIEPERGRVSPDFIEYQDAADTGVDGGSGPMETRAIGTSPIAPEVPIRIPSTSDIAEVRSHPDDHLSPNLPSEYHHDEYDSRFHFVPAEHAQQVHAEVVREAAAATTWEVEHAPLTSYEDEADDSDKENHNPNQEDGENAEEVPRSCQDAQRMGPRC